MQNLMRNMVKSLIKFHVVLPGERHPALSRASILNPNPSPTSIPTPNPPPTYCLVSDIPLFQGFLEEVEFILYAGGVG